jgi:LEA14-like dessication related protein
MSHPARLALVSIVAALAACAGRPRLPPPPVTPVEPPRLVVESFVPQEADALGVTLAVQGRIENPNPVDLSVSRWTYQLQVEGQPAGSGQLTANLLLRRAGAVPVTIPARLGWANVPGFLAMLATRQSVAVRVSGVASVRAPGGAIDLPWAADGAVVLPRLPAVALRGAAIREAGLFQTVVELRIEVQNPNPFPLPTGRLAYDLSIAGSPVAQAASSSLGQVPPGGAATVTIPVRFSSVGAMAGLVTGATRGSAEVVLRGQVEYGALGVALEARAALGR